MTLLVAATLFSGGLGQPALTTTLGDVVGVENGPVEVFYGIPYAEPPTGERRFLPPEAATAWGNDPRYGTVKQAACWQFINTSSETFAETKIWYPETELNEDCLYLNVWRQKPAEGDQPKTIMVWIHGGGFWNGAADLDLYDGTQLAANQDVIVVSIAYRLGALGFLYLEDQITGNAGLLDQALALKWVKDNAANLGGSADDITIFGQGSGGVSVGLHMMNSESSENFARAIMQSISPLAYWAITDTERTAGKVKDLAQLVECEDNDGLLACLRAVPAEKITRQQMELKDTWGDIPIGPIVDGTFIKKDPSEMLREGDIKKTSVLLGNDLNEGIFWAINSFPEAFNWKKKGKIGDDDFNNILDFLTNDDNDLKTRLVKMYDEEFDGKSKRRMRIVDAASGDSLYKCSVVEFARQYTEVGGQAFLYSFEQKLKSNPWPGWMGVIMGVEVKAVFGVTLDEAYSTRGDRDVTNAVMSFWTSFARAG